MQISRRSVILGGVSVALVGCSSPSARSPQSVETLVKRNDLYDQSRIHSIALDYSAVDFDKLIAAYAKDSDKVWVRATVTIDGSRYQNAGLRLKGNSSLFGLGSSSEGAGAGQAVRRGPNRSDESTPELLPWLIRLDKYVDGQNHGGETRIVIRSSNTTTALNEAVALDMLGAAGLATQRCVSVRFSAAGRGRVVNGGIGVEPEVEQPINSGRGRVVNGGIGVEPEVEQPINSGRGRVVNGGIGVEPEVEQPINSGRGRVVRLAMELPAQTWTTRTLGAGPLYKAKSGGDYSYLGEDASAYANAFEQEAGKDDFVPLTAFLKFINESSDSEFALNLKDHLDVDSFATYLAMQDLLGNFDDIDGPGNNSYLYADPTSGQMTVVAWDHNLALTDGPGFGGGPGAQGDMQIVNGMPGMPGMPGMVEVGDADRATAGEVAAGDRPMRVGPGNGNILAQRFNANETFAANVASAKTRLTSSLITSGSGLAFLADRAAVIASDASDLVTTDALTSEVEAIATRLAAR